MLTGKPGAKKKGIGESNLSKKGKVFRDPVTIGGQAIGDHEGNYNKQPKIKNKSFD
jgi:hypothetical protein